MQKWAWEDGFTNKSGLHRHSVWTCQLVLAGAFHVHVSCAVIVAAVYDFAVLPLAQTAARELDALVILPRLLGGCRGSDEDSRQRGEAEQAESVRKDGFRGAVLSSRRKNRN